MYNLRQHMEMLCVKGNQPRFVAQATIMHSFGILVILFKVSALRKKRANLTICPTQPDSFCLNKIKKEEFLSTDLKQAKHDDDEASEDSRDCTTTDKELVCSVIRFPHFFVGLLKEQPKSSFCHCDLEEVQNECERLSKWNFQIAACVMEPRKTGQANRANALVSWCACECV